ncbi:hypothetical protein [Nocardia pseudobrasiliensis]|uniref:Uncharacterized protein n=1 Tax=Nocardia pseudobrasiliensis TaxID=45979 RepID=A0A370HXP9_9NOCA|nr:hypothetical protein [Nocardia pseudobrasiliensis]RDI63288.1 hypothetical protein DFR76_111307 [Nocardia pseudobrasiliensis]
MAGIRIGLAALPLAIALGYSGLAQAEPGPVQPGVTTAPDTEEPAELRAATPQSPAPAPAPRPRPNTPQKTETPPPPPPPRSVRIGEFEAPVPDGVPDSMVQDLQNAINPPTPQP